MVRVISAAVLILVVVGTIWFLPPIGTLVLGLIAGALAFMEYVSLAGHLGVRVPAVVSLVATLATTVAVSRPGVPLDVVLIAAMITIGAIAVATGRPATERLRDAAGGLFPLLYLGLPIGSLVAVRSAISREAVLVLIAIIVISDSGQYYTGRLLGRHALAPAISPKKTIEGAVGGFVVGIVAAVALGMWWLPGLAPVALALLGATIVLLGIVGDLFESLLKRSAGVKDSGSVIPGHGGMLDRIDSWLFAAPVYYVFLRYAAVRP